MNYAEARQRKSDKRWDWTTKNGRVWPTGYCAGWIVWTPELAARVSLPLAVLQAEQTKEQPYRAKYHTDGHESREDAERCFYEYSLDHLKTVTMARHRVPCVFPGCAEWTQTALESPGMGGLFPLVELCAEHCTRAAVERIHPFGGGLRLIHS